MGGPKAFNNDDNYTSVRSPRPSGDPNPKNFELLAVEQIGMHLVVHVRYPDAVSYEGVKVLLILNRWESQLRAATELDPHFGRQYFAPFARFEPTGKGLAAARALAEQIDPHA